MTPCHPPHGYWTLDRSSIGLRWTPAQPSHRGSTLADILLTIGSSLWQVHILGCGSHHHFGTLYGSHLEPMGGSFISCHRKLFGWGRICLKIKTFCPGSWREMLRGLGVNHEEDTGCGKRTQSQLGSRSALSSISGPLGGRKACFRERS